MYRVGEHTVLTPFGCFPTKSSSAKSNCNTLVAFVGLAKLNMDGKDTGFNWKIKQLLTYNLLVLWNRNTVCHLFHCIKVAANSSDFRYNPAVPEQVEQGELPGLQDSPQAAHVHHAHCWDVLVVPHLAQQVELWSLRHLVGKVRFEVGCHLFCEIFWTGVSLSAINGDLWGPVSGGKRVVRMADAFDDCLIR